MSAKSVLLQQWLRSDAIWTSYIAFRFLKRIPFQSDVRALVASQYWSRADLDDLARTKVAALLRHSARIPVWAERFTQSAIDPAKASFEDLMRLPVTSKKDFLGREENEVLDMSLKDASTHDHTSGSTGIPFHFYLDRHFELRSYAICERMIRAANKGRRVPIVSMRARHKMGFAFFKHYFFLLQNYNSVKHRLPALQDLLATMSESVMLYGFASSFIELARRVKEAGIRLPVASVMSTGENVRASDRALIESELGPFFINYATRELGWLAFECEEHRLHLNEEWAYVEIVDENGDPVPEGEEGRVVVSVFENRVMPFIRYANGDRARIHRAPCACGRTLATIEVRGREVEYIQFEDGRTVSVLDLASPFDGAQNAVHQYQIRHIDALVFSVTVVPKEAFARSKDVLEQHLIAILHPRAQIEWTIVEEIPAAKSGKAQYFVPRA